MPSPFGHALAGVATAWASDKMPPGTSRTHFSDWWLTALCIALAVLPDADLLYAPIHRRASHSVGAVIIIFIVSTIVTAWVTGRLAWRIPLICAAAYGSHILLDWLGSDPNPPNGIQALWPFSTRWLISGLDVFPGTERRHLFTLAAWAVNAKAVFWELVILGPIVALVAWLRRRLAA